MTKVLTSLLLLTLMACGQTQVKQASETKAPIDGWATLSAGNYSIQHPPNWEVNQSGTMNTSFLLFSPLEDSQDQFRENVNLIIQSLPDKSIDLDKFTEISEAQIKTMITNVALMESTRVKQGAETYHKLIYTGDQGMYKLQFEQYYWVADKQVYVLTLTCEQSTFSDFQELGETIMNSFSFRN